MAQTREGETVDIYSSGQRTPYGELIQGVDETGKTKFFKTDNDGKLKTQSETPPLDIIIAVDSISDTISYIGRAAIGALTSNSIWQIRKLDETSGLSITWADGDSKFDNKWDDRESLPYS